MDMRHMVVLALVVMALATVAGSAMADPGGSIPPIRACSVRVK